MGDVEAVAVVLVEVDDRRVEEEAEVDGGDSLVDAAVVDVVSVGEEGVVVGGDAIEQSKTYRSQNGFVQRSELCVTTCCLCNA